MNFTEFSQRIRDNIARVVIGKTDVVELLLAALLVEGHVLLEDVPGVGKTTLAKGAGPEPGLRLIRASSVRQTC
jgi:MoxR-like ATPase